VIKPPAHLGSPGATLLGFGGYRPAGQLRSDELARRFGKDADWVLTRTGMRTRRVAGERERVLDMAEAAARDALTAGPVPADQLDLIIVASCTAESPHGVAARLGPLIGAPSAASMDINAACAGFCYSLAVASDAVRAGSARHVLVVGAEKMTAWVDPDDLPTAIVFGDGAGAALVGPGERPGIGPVVWGSDGEQADLIHINAERTMRMSGQAVFRWATSEIPPIALEACRRAGVSATELAAIVPHQANMRIVRSLANRITAEHAVLSQDGAESGNTSAASIPLALHALTRNHEVAPGELALLVGFGAGLSYAAQVVRLPDGP
jgi:3-oxoacyl-[acyl-carrier-protein] synthase III